jgi:hypothetical protein
MYHGSKGGERVVVSVPPDPRRFALSVHTPTTSLKHYASSADWHRGFCSECGSFLYIRPASSEDYTRVTIAVGTIDALYLFGEGADGEEVPVGGFGRALANGGGDHEWCRNEIPGVTEKIALLGRERGKRWDTDPT